DREAADVCQRLALTEGGARLRGAVVGDPLVDLGDDVLVVQGLRLIDEEVRRGGRERGGVLGVEVPLGRARGVAERSAADRNRGPRYVREAELVLGLHEVGARLGEVALGEDREGLAETVTVRGGMRRGRVVEGVELL